MNGYGYKPDLVGVYDFLRQQRHCVISTIGPDGYPQGATVAFSATWDMEVIFGTSNESRKFANLLSDPRVAITVTDEVKRYTLQYRGEAEIIDSEVFAHYRWCHFAKLPGSLKFEGQPDQVYFLVHPRSVRFSDCKPDPWRVTELRLLPPLGLLTQ